jgi:hypothetical protein
MSVLTNEQAPLSILTDTLTRCRKDPGGSMSLLSSLHRLPVPVFAAFLALAPALAACTGDDSTDPLVGDAGTDASAKDGSADGASHDGSASDAAHDAAADAPHATTDAADDDAPSDAANGG